MCGEFGEVTVIIGLVINFLAFVSPLLTLRDTLTYLFSFKTHIFLENCDLIYQLMNKWKIKKMDLWDQDQILHS